MVDINTKLYSPSEKERLLVKHRIGIFEQKQRYLENLIGNTDTKVHAIALKKYLKFKKQEFSLIN